MYDEGRMKKTANLNLHAFVLHFSRQVEKSWRIRVRKRETPATREFKEIGPKQRWTHRPFQVE